MPPETKDQPEVIEVEPAGELVRAVIEMGNGPAKRTLGFLPDQGFLDRARKGTLLAATLNSRLLGYALYDLSGYEIKLRYLCVAEDARHQGVARQLVDSIVERHRDRHRLVLSCRYDYEATAVWKALDFRPHTSRPGRSQAGHALTVWVRDLEHRTLLDEYEDDRPAAALDHNVFLDLHMPPAQRPQGQESRHLLDDWIAECVELCVTDEVFHEIHRHENSAERAAEQKAALLYRNLSRPGDDWTALIEEAASLAPKADKADHRHVARAAAGGARYLVSRDGNLLQAADAIEPALGLRVLPPEALIVRLDRIRSDDPYRPAALAGTELVLAAPSEEMHREVIGSLLNHAAGERRSELGSLVRPMFADRTRYEVQVVQASGDRIVGGFARKAAGRELVTPLIRVAPGTRGANVIARQMLFDQRKHAADTGLEAVRITDQRMSRDIRHALRSEGFEDRGGSWDCTVETGLLRAEEIDIPEPLTRQRAVELEDKAWPVKVVGAGIETYLVPIKVPFAEALLDPGLAEQSLLPRQLGLGLNREHVYYRNPGNSRGLSGGARVLWYVTGGAPTHPRGSIRAISQVADVVVGRPRSLHARFERLGIYTAQQVSAAADGNGQVMAIRFVNTEVLDQPLDLDDLKTLWANNDQRFHPPPSPTQITEHMFCQLYRQSSAYAG